MAVLKTAEHRALNLSTMAGAAGFEPAILLAQDWPLIRRFRSATPARPRCFTTPKENQCDSELRHGRMGESQMRLALRESVGLGVTPVVELGSRSLNFSSRG